MTKKTRNILIILFISLVSFGIIIVNGQGVESGKYTITAQESTLDTNGKLLKYRLTIEVVDAKSKGTSTLTYWFTEDEVALVNRNSKTIISIANRWAARQLKNYEARIATSTVIVDRTRIELDAMNVDIEYRKLRGL